jgi:hypothetical protein
VKLAPALACACLLGACGSSNSGGDAGPPIEAQAYFALQPGQCFAYQDDAGDVVSLDIVPVASPAGVAIVRSQSGLVQEKDFLVFDGGIAFLAERNFTPLGLTDVYTTPLVYLSAPLTRTSVTSASSYTEGNSAGMQTMGYETLIVAPEVDIQPWTGYGSAASSDEDKISFSFNGVDGGTLVFSWLTPELGFTDLSLPNPAGVFVDYLLTAIHPDNAGCP